MDVSEEQSARYIGDLAQAPPFRFVDRVVYLDESRVIAELHGRGSPERFADPARVDTYAVLEFAAQSSGMVLRGRKQPGRRGVISSFQQVQRKGDGALRYPLRIESTLTDDRMSFFEFHFKVHSDADLAIEGTINIHLGG